MNVVRRIIVIMNNCSQMSKFQLILGFTTVRVQNKNFHTWYNIDIICYQFLLFVYYWFMKFICWHLVLDWFRVVNVSLLGKQTCVTRETAITVGLVSRECAITLRGRCHTQQSTNYFITPLLRNVWYLNWPLILGTFLSSLLLTVAIFVLR